MGGETVVNINNGFDNAIESGLKNASGYGGIAYTGSALVANYRIYYIFRNNHLGFATKWIQ